MYLEGVALSCTQVPQPSALWGNCPAKTRGDGGFQSQKISSEELLQKIWEREKVNIELEVWGQDDQLPKTNAECLWETGPCLHHSILYYGEKVFFLHQAF